MIDTVAGAQSSAIIYSIAETAKANNLNPHVRTLDTTINETAQTTGY